VLSLAYLAIAARSLGPEQLGVLILVHAYAVVVAGVAGFQSWQAIIRFGAPMQQGEDRQALKSLIRFAIRIGYYQRCGCIFNRRSWRALCSAIYGLV